MEGAFRSIGFPEVCLFEGALKRQSGEDSPPSVILMGERCPE
jgi:hypothetical protein